MIAPHIIWALTVLALAGMAVFIKVNDSLKLSNLDTKLADLQATQAEMLGQVSRQQAAIVKLEKALVTFQVGPQKAVRF